MSKVVLDVSMSLDGFIAGPNIREAEPMGDGGVYIRCISMAHKFGGFLSRCTMFLAVQVLTIFLVSVAMALALAHALEFPGKMRLDKQTYLAMQPIHYPGFTIGGGVGEAGGIIATLLLLLLTPPRAPAFRWTVLAFVALLAMHAAYWIFTHPLNKFWMKGHNITGVTGGFFSFSPVKRDTAGRSGEEDRKRIRNRWEYSHVLRAVLAGISLVLLAIAVAM